MNYLPNMRNTYYRPWKGKNFKPGGLLILSESAYAWDGGSPQSDHPTSNTVRHWALKCFDGCGGKRQKYVVAITRALCGEKEPSLAKRKQAWSELSYSIYVQRRMKGKWDKPSKADCVASQRAFLDLIQTLRPARVVITSYKVWRWRPDPHENPADRYMQSYRLSDGSLVWCLAVPHPASRTKGHGFAWKNIGERIKRFREMSLPTK